MIMPGLSLFYRKLSLLEITILLIYKFDRKKAKDKYFVKKLDNNNNNNNGLLTDPLDGSSLLKYINYK